MIILLIISMLICRTTQNRMTMIITFRTNFPTTINKRMLMLGSQNSIKHNRIITACRIFHSNRHFNSTRSQTVLLVFHRTRSYRNITQNIIKILIIFRIKHFVRKNKTSFFHSTHMHSAAGNNSLKQIRFCFRVRLMKHSFITFSSSSRFVRVNSRNKQNFVCNFFLHRHKTIHIIQNRIFIICRTRSDNQNHFIRPAFKHSLNLVTLFFHNFADFSSHRILLFNLSRNSQPSFKIHIHII